MTSFSIKYNTSYLDKFLDSPWKFYDGNIYNFKGDKVGINNNNPEYNLDISGTMQATKLYGDGSSLTGLATSSSETLNNSGTLSTDVTVSYITGKNFILPDSNTNGLVKTIINKNPNIYESIGDIQSSGNYGMVVTSVKYNPVNKSIYTTGSFEKAGGVPCYGTARYDIESGQWFPLGQGLVGLGVSTTDNGIDVDSIGNVYIGGTFTQVKQTDGTVLTVNYIAKWNIQTSLWEALGSGATKGLGASCSSILCYGTDVYFGGSFTSAGGTALINRITRYDTLTGTFNTLGVGANSNEVSDIIIHEGFLYAVGNFTNIGGQSPASLKLGKWNLTTNTWVSVPWYFDVPRACLIYDQKFYTVGLGPCRNNNGGIQYGSYGVGRFDLSSGYPEPVGGGITRGSLQFIQDMTNIFLNGTDIYMVGNNIEFQTNGCYRIAKFIPSLNRVVNVGDGINPSIIFSLDKDMSGNLYVGGFFDGSGYNKFSNICRINLNNQPKITGKFVFNGAPCSTIEFGNLNSSISLIWNGSSWSLSNKNDDVAIY